MTDRPGCVRHVRHGGYRLGLIGMCAPDAPARRRACERAQFVEAEVFSSEAGLRKPHPTIYGQACDLLRVEPDSRFSVRDGACGELTGAEIVHLRDLLDLLPGATD